MLYVWGLLIIGIGSASVVFYRQIAELGLSLDRAIGARWPWPESIQLMRAMSLGFGIYLTMFGVLLMSRGGV